MNLDQSTLSRNLRGLEREGLVEIAIVERDLRRRAVWLTEKGARRLEAAIPVWRAAHSAVSDLIDPVEVRNLTVATEALAGAAVDQLAATH
jgi:DNA-binding MarR family transcriptional regulator